MLRRDSGAPIRTAMNRAGLDIKALAARTREVDPEGRGISKSLVGYAVSSGRTAREEFSERASVLISTALDEPLGQLFHAEDSSTSSESASASTSRLREEMTSGPPIEPLLDTKGLAKAIKKSPTWIYHRRREHPRGAENPFPLHMIGHSPRFRLSEVLAWCDAVYAEDSVAA
jgi:predicted DNA-binding transcriptional regulator AlpA